jgi:PAS domain S-box-containing protein
MPALGAHHARAERRYLSINPRLHLEFWVIESSRAGLRSEIFHTLPGTVGDPVCMASQTTRVWICGSIAERFMSNEGNMAAEALTIPEQELRLLLDAIPTLVWTAGPGGDIGYVNKRVLEYLGATLGEIIGRGWVEKVHPDDVAFKTNTWVANLESGTAHDAVCRFRGVDGQYRWFAVRGEPLRGGDGRVLNWYGVLIDIDDRRKADEALRESEYKLRQITDTVPGLIWSNGPNGEPTHINQRMLDYSGIPGRLSRNRKGFLSCNSDRNFVPRCAPSTPGGRRVSLAPCSL